MKGIDISNHQRNTPDLTGLDFVFIKATEGVGYKDPRTLQHFENAKKEGKLVGLYHYARTERNRAENEAQTFLQVAKPLIDSYPFILLALDFEGQALTVSDAYAREWVNEFNRIVKQETGRDVLIYASESEFYRFKGLNFPAVYWVAKWSKKEPGIPWMLWQYNNSPVDMDEFRGDLEAWKMLANETNRGDTRRPRGDREALEEVAVKCILGYYGNSEERRQNVRALGLNPDEVQKRINAYYIESAGIIEELKALKKKGMDAKALAHIVQDAVK